LRRKLQHSCDPYLLFQISLTEVYWKNIYLMSKRYLNLFKVSCIISKDMEDSILV
jgi:hypothetical protein